MHSNFPDCVCALQHHTHTHEQQQCRAGFFGDQTQPRLQTNGRSLSSTQNMHNAACCEKHCGSSCWKCGQNRYRAMTGTLQRQHQHMRVPIVCIADATSLPFMPKHVTLPKKTLLCCHHAVSSPRHDIYRQSDPKPRYKLAVMSHSAASERCWRIRYQYPEAKQCTWTS